MDRVMHVPHSTLTQESGAEALTLSIDEECWTVFSPSGFRGDRSLFRKITSATRSDYRSGVISKALTTLGRPPKNDSVRAGT